MTKLRIGVNFSPQHHLLNNLSFPQGFEMSPLSHTKYLYILQSVSRLRLCPIHLSVYSGAEGREISGVEQAGLDN